MKRKNDFELEEKLMDDPVLSAKTEVIFERLIESEGYDEGQAWEIAMCQAGKADGDFDIDGSEAELFVHGGEGTGLEIEEISAEPTE